MEIACCMSTMPHSVYAMRQQWPHAFCVTKSSRKQSSEGWHNETRNLRTIKLNLHTKRQLHEQRVKRFWLTFVFQSSCLRGATSGPCACLHTAMRLTRLICNTSQTRVNKSTFRFRWRGMKKYAVQNNVLIYICLIFIEAKGSRQLLCNSKLMSLPTGSKRAHSGGLQTSRTTHHHQHSDTKTLYKRSVRNRTKEQLSRKVHNSNGRHPTQRDTHTHIHIRINTLTCKQTTHTHIYTHTPTHTQTHTHIYTHSLFHTHTHTWTHFAHTHTHTHTCTYPLTHTNTHTHDHVNYVTL